MRPVHEIADVFLHVVRETDAAQSSAAPRCLPLGQRSRMELSWRRIARRLWRSARPKISRSSSLRQWIHRTRLLCRTSYEQNAAQPFDHPLSSRFDENDAVLIFDEAFIPWENFLVYRNVERANSFYPASGFFNRFNLQSATRLAVKLDFMTGLLARALAYNGTDGFRGVQAALGDVVAWRTMMWAMTAALAGDPQPAPAAPLCPEVNTPRPCGSSQPLPGRR